jgi:hypothetical protein
MSEQHETPRNNATTTKSFLENQSESAAAERERERESVPRCHAATHHKKIKFD